MIQYGWNCMDDLSFLLINTMISMPVPGIVQMVQAVLLNFIYIDILLTDLWMPKLLFQADTTDMDLEGLNQYLEDNGFSSKLLVTNLGSGFVYLLVYLFLCATYFLSSLLGRKVSMYFYLSNSYSFQRLAGFLSRHMFWNNSLTLFFSQYPPMILGCLINLFDVIFLPYFL